MAIAAPKDLNEASGLLHYALHEHEGPFAIRYPRASTEEIPTECPEIPFGSWEIVLPLKRVNVVTYGPVVPEFEREILKSGKEIGLVNARYIKPLDENFLRMLAGRKAIVYEEVVRQGSLGMMMLASAEKAGLAIDFEFNAVPDMYVEHGEVDKIKKDLGLAIKDILAKC